MKLKNISLVFIEMALLFSCSQVYAEDDYQFDPTSPYHSLYVPDGKGPYPAILILHASTGVVSVNHDWAMRLKNHGYIVYLIDSFKPRGWQDRASVGWEKATAAQLSDVTPAYEYLTHLPEVDANHIGLLGFSMGGFSVLRAMQADNNVLFKAAASFYGVCHRLAPDAKVKGPTKIFIGADDDRATTEDCRQLLMHSGGEANQLSIREYQQALHGFDNYEFPVNKEVVDEKGEHYHVGFSETARELALQDLPDFFDKYLK